MKLKNKRVNAKEIIIASLIGVFLFLIPMVFGQSVIGNYQTNSIAQYSAPTFQQFYSSQGIDYAQFWPGLGGSCDVRGDFIVNVRPGGCSPAVVRSDLLEEQNVPVFCKLDAVKLNPIIDVASLKSVGFQVRGLDNYIAGISYHPSQIALRIYQPILNSPLINDMGYAIVVLKKQLNESSMPDFVEANLTAILTYDMQNIFGAGQTSFFLPEMSDSDWKSGFNQYAFWKGRGYLRADWMDADRAEIAVYNDAENVIRKLVLTKGQTSDVINIPGFYCQAGIRLNLKDLSSGKSRVRMQVDNNEFWMVEGEKFLDNCYVKSISKLGAGGQATLRCYGKDFILRIGVSDKVAINVDDVRKEVNLGESVKNDVYLAYVGMARGNLNDPTQGEKLFVVLVNSPEKTEKIDALTKIKQDALVDIANNFDSWSKEASNLVNSKVNWYEADSIKKNLANSLGAKSENIQIIFIGGSGKKDDKTQVDFSTYNLIESLGMKDKNYITADKDLSNDLPENYFSETSRRAYEIVNLYGSEKDSFGDYYGAKALTELADLAGILGKQKSELGVLLNLTQKYPDSSYSRAALARIDSLTYFNYESAGTLVSSGTENHYMKLEQVVVPGIGEASAKFSVKGTPASLSSLSSSTAGSSSSGSSSSSSQTETKLIDNIAFKYNEEISITYKSKVYKSIVNLPGGNRVSLNFNNNEIIILTDNSQDLDLDGDGVKDVRISVSEISDADAKITVYQLQTTTPTATSAPVASGNSAALLQINDQWFMGGKDLTNNEYAQLLELQDDQVKIKYSHRLTLDARTPTAEDKYIKKGESITLRTYNNDKVDKEVSLTLDEINFKRVAEVSVLSEMPNGISQANFTVRIGVEKRAIELNPDKTAERIANLNDSIEKFSKVVENLGKVVKVWKGACFATSGFLIVKNLFTNMGGKSLARQDLMKNYWKAFCQKEVSDKISATVEECYSKHNSDIEKSVDDYASRISEMNTLASSLEGKDAQVTRDNYKTNFKQFVNTNPEKSVKINNQDVLLKNAFGGANSDTVIDRMVKDGDLTVEEMRDIMLATKLSGSQAEAGNAMLSRDLTPIYQVAQRNQLISGYNLQSFGGNVEVQPLGDPKKIGKTEFVHVSSLSQEQTDSMNLRLIDMGYNTKAGDNFIAIPTYANANLGQGKDYSNQVIYVPLDKKGNIYTLAGKEGYVLDKDGQVTGTVISKDDMNKIVSNMGVASFTPIDSGMCNNKYLNPKVKFYETEPYKGMPAVVPLDVNKGWYAATKQILPGFGMTPYTSSGSASSLWLCNVGTDGKEDFNVLGDDLCIQLNYDTGQPQGQLMCLSEAEARTLAIKAKSLVENAASQYKTLTPGFGKINLPGVGSFSVEKAVSTVGTECTDFMSPSDCNLMFNVCDPVLCPSSRCNLGGSFYVDDVVQSGIIGSIALCLPNFGSPANGGVVVPVCLTGIYAGLDAYVSVLKAHKQCLEENLKTGAFTGICDEIYSIYLCEFFWRQGAPLLDMALPKIVEMLYTGGKTRGGGEYMTVSNAWDTAQNSLKYFTNYYAVNAMKAFQARSTSEVGTEVCKAFISTNYPSNKNMLDQLLTPENPVQFYAKFDEIAYSTATLPSTSQYKVYYHIFAGRDIGHYYQVYLRNPPQTATYAAQPYIYVASGYVGIGQSADETKDFTAPAGYKELCVRIDTQEECGFKQVTTEFAIDYLKDLYMNEQATEQITSEKNCVSGTPSLYSLANPNLQEAGQEMLQPAIYQRGLIRVCATNNPGNSTSPTRWKDVGYCDDSRIRCWLDGESVANVIQDKNLENDALKTAEQIMNQQDIAQGNLWTEDNTISQLQSAKDKFSKINFESIMQEDLMKFIKGETSWLYTDNMRNTLVVLDLLENITQKALFNKYKVDAMFLKFEIYYKLSKRFKQVLDQPSNTAAPASGISAGTPITTPASPAAPVTSTGFEARGGPVYFMVYFNNGEFTKINLHEVTNGYQILYVSSSGEEQNIGAITNQEIQFNDRAPQIAVVAELKKYIFDGKNFVSKTGASSAAKSIKLYIDESP
ncbi:MAG: hypothetical protein NT076_00485, partial [Candidatus Pacearchaeota archaeon]|nr:hypothetical protein [Candidatus Pacearchaeota archaeon]